MQMTPPHPLLGRPVGHHAAKFDVSDGLGGVVASAIPLGLGLLGVAGTIEALMNDGEVTVLQVGMTAFLTLLGSAIVALVIRRMLHKRGQTVDVFEGGLLWRFGGKEHLIAWSAVAAARWLTIVRSNGLVKGHRLYFTLTDGRKLSLDQWVVDLPSLKDYVARFVRFS